MPTLVLDPAPHELEALIERRKQSGLHRLDEVLIVEPRERKIHWLSLSDGEYREVKHSALIELSPAELVAQIDWP